LALPILASDQRIDLLISDVGLPGMNGRQLAAEIANSYTSPGGDRALLPVPTARDEHDYPMIKRFDNSGPAMSKVPEVTLGFWLIKILATTLGETGGDTVTMTMNLGYLTGTAIFLSLLIVLVAFQIRARSFHPALYWATIVGSTTAGTTLADFADRSLGIGYAGGSSLLLICVLAVLGLWHRSQGSVSVATVNTPKVESFYWATITFSQTLGTALGDWTADDTGLGYLGAALVFGTALALLAAAYFWTRTSRVLLFWAAFILTRPLGATLGDFLDKPVTEGGLALSRPLATAVMGAAIVLCVWIIPQRAGTHPNVRR
jgi:uncharacterized membrane-anchored protein